MIRNRLAELLAERQLKISRVAAEIPNLSRNTITSTAQNNGKMIQLDTINSLCQYLEISPKDFFEYLPFDIYFDTTITQNYSVADSSMLNNVSIKKEAILFDLYIKVKSFNSKTLTFGYSGFNTDDSLWGNELSISLKKDDKSDFKKIWDSKISPGFRPVIWAKLKENIAKALNESMTVHFGGADAMLIQLEKDDIRLTTDFYLDLPF